MQVDNFCQLSVDAIVSLQIENHGAAELGSSAEIKELASEPLYVNKTRARRRVYVTFYEQISELRPPIGVFTRALQNYHPSFSTPALKSTPTSNTTCCSEPATDKSHNRAPISAIKTPRGAQILSIFRSIGFFRICSSHFLAGHLRSANSLKGSFAPFETDLES